MSDAVDSMLLNMTGAFGISLQDIVKQSIDSIEYHRKDIQGNYTFLINNSDDINFRKIADDLSYADPLRIVESNGKLWAVVHHTVNDKYLRSDICNKGICHIASALVITSGIAIIEPSDIKSIVNVIREIKQARWVDCKGPLGLVIPVSVTKVKV